jgi:hypothetical protein
MKGRRRSRLAYAMIRDVTSVGCALRGAFDLILVSIAKR